MIYLDNAATTGYKPPQVIRAVEYALKNYSANPGRSGHTFSERTAMAVYTARKKTAEFFGADGVENVCFTQGCTHSINCVLKGVLKENDHVIVSSFEHNSVMRPLKKTGVKFDIAPVSFTDDDETVENFRKLINKNTRLIFVTGASNVCGKRLPIEKIGALCKAHGILFGVDAAQIAGTVPINVKKLNIDYLCVAPHKGLYAPMGIGILIAQKELPFTVIEGGTGTESHNYDQPDTMPERIESGTVNVPGIMGVAAGIDFVKKTGIENISNHEYRLIKKLYRHLKAMPFVELYTPEPTKELYSPVLSFNVRNVPSYKVSEILNKNGIAVRSGLHCSPNAHKVLNTIENGTVRVSVSYFNSDTEIIKLITVLKNVKFV